jgi:hypothetical protein
MLIFTHPENNTFRASSFHCQLLRKARGYVEGLESVLSASIVGILEDLKEPLRLFGSEDSP